jgi:aryl-alcohol dehydrogenase-like predicted oxidoreductase
MATARMPERKKLSTGKLTIFKNNDLDITLIKIRVEKIAKAKGISMAQLSLAWIMTQKGIFPFYFYSFHSF